MSSIDHLNQTAVPEYLMTTVNVEGLQASTGGKALREALKRGSANEVMDLFKSMNANGVAQSLREAGFSVEPALIEQGRSAVFVSVQSDLSAALDLRCDGFDLNNARSLAVARHADESFAAKENRVNTLSPTPEVFPADFNGNFEAVSAIRRVMRSSQISVALLGDADPSKRNSLLLVAGQALKTNIQGFGFDGIKGKYKVPLTMAGVHELHRHAAKAVAEESVLSGLGVWSKGEKVEELDAWVPDSMQRLLHGSVLVESAKLIMRSIENGTIGRHASEIGDHEYSKLLAEQGLDVNAPPIEDQAEKLGLVITEPDRIKGEYFGFVLAVDHRAALVKVSRVDLIELKFSEMANEQSRLQMGDSVRFGYKNGLLTATVIAKAGREETRR